MVHLNCSLIGVAALWVKHDRAGGGLEHPYIAFMK